jgi:hypothetical protein
MKFVTVLSNLEAQVVASGKSCGDNTWLLSSLVEPQGLGIAVAETPAENFFRFALPSRILQGDIPLAAENEDEEIVEK